MSASQPSDIFNYKGNASGDITQPPMKLTNAGRPLYPPHITLKAEHEEVLTNDGWMRPESTAQPSNALRLTPLAYRCMLAYYMEQSPVMRTSVLYGMSPIEVREGGGRLADEETQLRRLSLMLKHYDTSDLYLYMSQHPMMPHTVFGDGPFFDWVMRAHEAWLQDPRRMEQLEHAHKNANEYDEEVVREHHNRALATLQESS